jgi:DNA ligase 1
MKNITFLQVCKVFENVEKTSSRNEMADIFSNFYKNLNKQESQILSYLILGRVAPHFVNSEFNYSERSFLSLLKDLIKTKELKEDIDKKRKNIGDIGDTMQYFSEKLKYRSKNIALTEIYEILWKIVNTTGTGSVDIKNKIIVEILEKISPLEAKYFSRIVCGSLRFGVSDKTLLDVFSYVIQGDKGLRDELDRAYGVYADIGYICSLIVDGTKEEVEKRLKNVKMQPGIPVKPRLVERVSTFEEVFERLGDSILAQYKYDGLRCQIHKFKAEDSFETENIWREYVKDSGEESLFTTQKNDFDIKLFTRNLEDVTEMFPEIVQEAINMKEESFILDSEVLGWNTEEGKFLTFQETMQRRRKHNIKEMQGLAPVRAVVFDILFLNNNDISRKDTQQRVDILRDIKTGDSITMEDTKEINSLDELNVLFDEAMDLGLEGIIVKNKKGGYLPGVRNYEWIKLKKSMDSKLVDSIDLVVIGYNLGSGRRSGLGIGSVLGALYNPKEDVFEGVCNVGTGFKDEDLKSVYTSLKKYVLEKKPKNVRVEDSLIPDVYVEPSIVFTVEADEVSKRKDSNIYSLRFPRLIEWGRDKGITEVVTKKELEGMYGI